MILLMRNRGGVLDADCDYAAVTIDKELVEAIARRAMACRAMHDGDPSLAEASYWDPNPKGMRARGDDAADAIDRALDDGDGWALLDDSLMEGLEAVACDCTKMTISVGGGTAVLWACRVGSAPVQTVDVGLNELAARLGHPMGDPLAVIP